MCKILNFVFRVNGGPKTGSGHFMRCLNLARYLIKRKHHVQFITNFKNEKVQILELEKIAFNRVGYNNQFDDVFDEEEMNVFDQLTDVGETARFLPEKKIDWVIVDSYKLGQIWETEIRKYAERIMVIDDFTCRRHDCDLFLNQNTVDWNKQNDPLIPEHSHYLVGPKFALIDAIYSEKRKSSRERSCVKNILLYFGGGAVAEDITDFFVDILSKEPHKDLFLCVVLNSVSMKSENIREKLKDRGNYSYFQYVDNFLTLFEATDLAIGAGGMSAWERCFAGVPSLVLSTAQNQNLACEYLRDNGFIAYLGEWNSLTANHINVELSRLIEDFNGFVVSSKRSRGIVDGKGIKRVAKILEGLIA